jgi:hypothetical protein
MRSLPTPTRGGELDDMRPFINLDEDGPYQLWASQRVGLVSVAKAA